MSVSQEEKYLGIVNLVKVYVWVFIYFQNSPFYLYDIRVSIVLVKYILLCYLTNFILYSLVLAMYSGCLKFMHSSNQSFSLQSTWTRDMCLKWSPRIYGLRRSEVGASLMQKHLEVFLFQSCLLFYPFSSHHLVYMTLLFRKYLLKLFYCLWMDLLILGNF